MRFDTKIAVIVRDDLAPWQKLNVTAFLAGGLVGAAPALAGAPYVDGSGRRYGPLVRQPILVFRADLPALQAARRRAAEREVTVSIYTADLFATGNDDDNRAAVARVPGDRLDLVGLAVHAGRRDVDRIVRGLDLHP